MGVPKELTELEFEAWSAFITQLKQAAFITRDDIDDVSGPWDPVFCALRQWSEIFAQLRRLQPPVGEIDERGHVKFRERVRDPEVEALVEAARYLLDNATTDQDWTALRAALESFDKAGS